MKRQGKKEDYEKDGGIVFDMLSVFDVIDKVHRQSRHLGQGKTLVNCKPKFYSVTKKLVQIYCESCYICMGANPVIPTHPSAKKLIISSLIYEQF